MLITRLNNYVARTVSILTTVDDLSEGMKYSSDNNRGHSVVGSERVPSALGACRCVHIERRQGKEGTVQRALGKFPP
jgi:hypothetical protein